MTSPTPDNKNSSRNLVIGNICILIAAIFWGMNVSFTKVLIPTWMSSEAVSAVRIIGGCVLFWIASLFIHNSRIDRSDWTKLIVGGVVGLFGFIFLFVMSLRYANAIDVSIIMTLPPMVVILINALFRHSKPSLLEIAGIIVSFAGAAIVILSGHTRVSNAPNPLLGDLLAIASTVCYALYLVILEGPTRKYQPVTMLRWVFLFAAIPGCFLLFGFDSQPIWHAQTVAPWIYILFILLCPTFLAYLLVQPAIRDVGSETVSLYQYLVPVFATISAVIMGIASLKIIEVVAMAVIIAGMVLTNVGKRRRLGQPKLSQPAR